MSTREARSCYSMAKGAVIHAYDCGAPYRGNFLTSQLALAEQTRERLGLRSHFLLPTRASERPG
jgi:hypothetical protein